MAGWSTDLMPLPELEELLCSKWLDPIDRHCTCRALNRHWRDRLRDRPVWMRVIQGTLRAGFAPSFVRLARALNWPTFNKAPKQRRPDKYPGLFFTWKQFKVQAQLDGALRLYLKGRIPALLWSTLYADHAVYPPYATLPPLVLSGGATDVILAAIAARDAAVLEKERLWRAEAGNGPTTLYTDWSRIDAVYMDRQLTTLDHDMTTLALNEMSGQMIFNSSDFTQ